MVINTFQLATVVLPWQRNSRNYNAFAPIA